MEAAQGSAGKRISRYVLPGGNAAILHSGASPLGDGRRFTLSRVARAARVVRPASAQAALLRAKHRPPIVPEFFRSGISCVKTMIRKFRTRPDRYNYWRADFPIR